MCDFVEDYEIKIVTINDELRKAINSGSTFVSFSEEFKLKYKQFLIDASKSENWAEIAEKIAFYLYVGVAQDELVQKQTTLQNMSINFMNMAALKDEHSKENIQKLNSTLTQKAEKEKKGGKARAAKDPKTQAIKQIEEVEYPLKKHLFRLRGRRTEFVTAMHVKYPIITNADTIKRLVDKLNKKNGITQKKTNKPIAT